ncbi:DUF4258 domain-containing protein [Patescibacteria group bacterium]
MIVFTKHSLDKFDILRNHNFVISKSDVLETLEKSDFIDYSRLPLLIAQRKIDETHVLRVVYKKENRNIKIITFYPGRIKKYEN